MTFQIHFFVLSFSQNSVRCIVEAKWKIVFLQSLFAILSLYSARGSWGITLRINIRSTESHACRVFHPCPSNSIHSFHFGFFFLLFYPKEQQSCWHDLSPYITYLCGVERKAHDRCEEKAKVKKKCSTWVGRPLRLIDTVGHITV